MSLTCSNTEIVCALGCEALLVGVDDHSDFPPDVVGRLPRVGPDLQVDPEAVAALAPDLVLASLTVPGHEHVVASLEALDLPVVAPEPLSLADVLRDVRDIAGLLGVAARGEALAAELEAGWEPVDVGDRPRPAIQVEWWPKPIIVPGARSWVTDLIERAGGRNPWSDRDVASTPLTADEVEAGAADAVVISWCGVPTHRYRTDVVTRREHWPRLPAARRDAVFPIAEAYLGRPGPRLVEGFRALRGVVAACGGVS